MDENDKSVTLAQFMNKPVYISSFCLNQREMLDGANNLLGKTDDDWKILHQPAGERSREGWEELGKGDSRGFLKGMYARVFQSPSDGIFETQNDLLGLPRRISHKLSRLRTTGPYPRYGSATRLRIALLIVQSEFQQSPQDELRRRYVQGSHSYFVRSHGIVNTSSRARSGCATPTWKSVLHVLLDLNACARNQSLYTGPHCFFQQ